MADRNELIARVVALIPRWMRYRITLTGPERYCQIKNDLYQVRNAGDNGNPPLSSWPHELLDENEEVLASLEHYFLTRCWVGSGQYPAWEVRLLCNVYGLGKKLGISPNHNPNNPVTPASSMQRAFQERGITMGIRDLEESGGTAPFIAMPPMYY